MIGGYSWEQRWRPACTARPSAVVEPSGYANQVTNNYGTVTAGWGMGEPEPLATRHATVGGGDVNRASGGAATVGGGDGQPEPAVTVPPSAGVTTNLASADYATVGGGEEKQSQR